MTKSLEEIIIELGHDPKDVKGIKALMKKKEDDIAALRKQLKLPITMHPQTTEVVQEKVEEDMMDLLMKMNQRLNETEQELEKALQEKQGVLTSQPSQTAPTVTTSLPTATTTVPSTVQATATSSLAKTVVGSSTTMTTKELIKVMEDLKLQVSELKETKEKLAKLEISYDKSKMTVVEKAREVKALENKFKALEKDLSLDKPLGEINGILWANISESISNVWRSIQIIYE